MTVDIFSVLGLAPPFLDYQAASTGVVINLTGSVDTALTLTGSLPMATQTDLEWFKGEDISILVTLDPPVDLSAASLQFTVRDRYGGTVLVEKTLTSGIALVDGPNGVFSITVDMADTDVDSFPSSCVYDVQRTTLGGRAVLAYGALAILPEVAL